MGQDIRIFSKHGLALIALARRPDLRIREVAQILEVSDRTAQAIVNDLVDEGMVERRREGRRNRYVVRGDRAVPDPGAFGHDLAGVVGAVVPRPLVPPSNLSCRAVVVGCCDHSFQEPLRHLLSEMGLLEQAEILLWPGGGSALLGPDGGRLLGVIESVVRTKNPERVVLVAHFGCSARGVLVVRRRDPFRSGRLVTERRGRAVEMVRERLGVEPEAWFLGRHGAVRVHEGPTEHMSTKPEAKGGKE